MAENNMKTVKDRISRLRALDVNEIGRGTFKNIRIRSIWLFLRLEAREDYDALKLQMNVNEDKAV